MSTQELGLILGSHVLPSGDLHYGYWKPGLEITWANLAVAQEAYSEFLIGHIPPGAKEVLDVGVGTGRFAERLVGRGYRVEGVSPSAALTEIARNRLGDAVHIYQCPFQELETERRYDVVIFSESFQYIPPKLSLPLAHKLLKPGGHVIIADFFKTEAKGKTPIGGGHRLTRFYPVLSEQPFTVLKDEDITAQTAPTMDLMARLLRDYGQPFYDILGSYFRNNHPWIAGVAGWIFRKKLEKLKFRLFSNRLDGEAFATFCSYRLLLLRRNGADG